MEASNYVPVHPNQHRGESRATRAAVILLLGVTAVLTTIVAVAGAPVAGSSGMQLFAFVYIILLVVMAYYVYKWSRGVLAMAAALAVLFGLLMIVAAAGWFQRDQAGFAEPLLPAAVIGLITIVLVPVQLLLVAFAMRGFNQAWNIEVLVPEEEAKENLADKFDEGGRRVEHEDDEGGDEEEHG
jgi:lysylphosphatidylglycerol synthetase-like protein (DUF2156 family)